MYYSSLISSLQSFLSKRFFFYYAVVNEHGRKQKLPRFANPTKTERVKKETQNRSYKNLCSRLYPFERLLFSQTFVCFQATSTKFARNPCSLKGGDPAAPSDTATLLRLHPSHQSYLRRLPPLRVSSPTLGTPDSHGVTGGVYKTRERIHPDMLIRDY